MDFRLTEDQRLIQATAREFLAEHAGAERLRAALASPAGWDEALWAGLGHEMGWLGVAVPERFGGSGLGYVELALLMEETGYALASTPFFPTVGLAVPAILEAATEGQQGALLPALAAGEVRAAVCLTGPSGAPAPQEPPAILTRDGAGFRLDGEAGFVAFGHVADLLIVLARAPGGAGRDGLSLIALPANTRGVAVERLVSLDLTRPYARVRFENVAVDAQAVLGEAETAGPAVERTLSIAAVLLAAEQVGGAQKTLDMSLDYAKQRVQFGRPIGSFQAIKHKLADMMVRIEAARSAAYYAACCATEWPEELAEAASVARAYCSDAYFQCAGDAIQVHGGVGFTWEHEAHLYFKRARASATLLGDAAHHREIVAGLIGLDDGLMKAPA